MDYGCDEDPRADRGSGGSRAGLARVNALLEDRGRFGEFVLVPMHVSADDLTKCVATLRRMRNFGGAINGTSLCNPTTNCRCRSIASRSSRSVQFAPR